MYQSQNSLHVNWRSVCAADAKSKDSIDASADAVTADRRDRIQRSASDHRSFGASSTGPSGRFMSAKREAFQSLFAKLRSPSIHFSASGTSEPSVAERNTAIRTASAPYRS